MRQAVIFIDGQSGTTGLKIRDRLAQHDGVRMGTIPPERRRDPVERRIYLNQADVVFLCLPDDVARESAGMIDQDGPTRVIDASTAHRVAEDWAYGLPELPGQRARIAKAKRVTVPGCHATAFIVAVRPLIDAGILAPDAPVSAQCITGYSGGGRELIQQYEAPNRDASFVAPRPYALGLKHKHLPEMTRYAGLSVPPVFHPILGDFYQGMTLILPLHPKALSRRATPASLLSVYQEAYRGEAFIQAYALSDEHLLDGKFSPMTLVGTNRCEIYVTGNQEHMSVLVSLDNLGKGSSGAAVQCMNIMMGWPEETGLA